MNQSEQMTRGAKAKALLDDPLYAESFELAKKAILAMFEGAASDERVIRSKQLLTALTLVRRVLEQAISDGHVAARTLEDERRGVSFLGDLRETWRSKTKQR